MRELSLKNIQISRVAISGPNHKSAITDPKSPHLSLNQPVKRIPQEPPITPIAPVIVAALARTAVGKNSAL